MITKWIVESYWVRKKLKKPIVESEKVEVLEEKKKWMNLEIEFKHLN